MHSDRAPTLDLAVALIARRSITPDDAGCQALIRERLAPLGFSFDPHVDQGVTNLWARRGSSRPLVCLAGHTDVVPPGPRDAWSSDPFAPVVRDGYLYGRGAADMKGSVAAFVTAVEGLVAAHPAHRGSIALAITSDEEGSSVDGTLRIVERLQAAGTVIDYCIVGEPSSEATLGDVVKNGRRGTLSGTLAVNGVQGHVAYPQLARNPIHEVAPALAELAAMRWDDGNEHFPPTTFQVSNLHAGTGAGNVIPGRLEAMFNFRYAPVSTRDGLASRLAAVLDRHGLDYEIAWTAHGEPFHTRRGRLVELASTTIRELAGVTPVLSCAGGTSDGRYLARICPEVLEIGPVNATIHKIDERVKAADLETLAAIYRRLLERLLGPEH